MLRSLNAPQRKAVETTEGRVLILAGAGSGKTSVLINRIAYLIEEKQVSPEAILGLTFTNKAAQEMRERIKQAIGTKRAKQLTLCTFHSFCMNLLRKEIHALGYTTDFSLYDEKDIRRLTGQLMRHLLEGEKDIPSVDNTIEQISYAKNRGLSYDEAIVDHPKSALASAHEKAFHKDVFERLQSCMRAYNAVDFDSLLSLTVQLFEEFPEVLKKVQARYRYFMIDEYQDTNPIQYRLALLLSKHSQNLCVVGDDDQSIYGWRGAEIKNILQFEADTTIKLEQNYRSTPTILSAANSVIQHNLERHKKTLWSVKESGEPISLFHAPTDGEEAQAVVQRMIALKKAKGIPWKEMAILYRSNLLSRPIELALMQAVWEKEGQWVRGIPYEVFGGSEFYERSEIRDMLAYLKAILNPLDQESLLRIINVPRRGISDKTLDMLTQINRTHNIPLWEVLKHADRFETLCSLPQRALSAIASFTDLMERAREKFLNPSIDTFSPESKRGPLSSTLEWFTKEIDYTQAIQEEVKSEKMRQFKWENIVHCIDVLAQYEKEKQEAGEMPSLHEFLTTTLLDREYLTRQIHETRGDKVSVMTFHSAKGLEFSACFLIGLEDHLIPHEKSTLERGLEEERRLFYVAMTRAKDHLTLSMARNRKRNGRDAASSPSRFLFEIPKDLVHISSWRA